MKIFTLERLISIDLNNPKDISINEIVESLFQELQNKYLDKLELFSLYLKVINLQIFNKKRKESIVKKFDSKVNKMIKQKLTYELLTEDNLNLTIEEWGESIQLTKSLHYKAVKMCLPLKDNNAEEKKKKDSFEKNKLELTILLNRMGKFDEAENIFNLEFSKVYTYSSYIKEWKEEKKALLENNPLIRNTIIDDLLSFIVINVKEQLLKNQEICYQMSSIGKKEKNSKKFENIAYLINYALLKENLSKNP